MRAGPKAAYEHGDAAVQGELTMAIGFSGGDPQTYVGVPLTFAAGATTPDGHPLLQLESGLEVARAFTGHNWGFRASLRAGGAAVGPSGAVLGLRAGPMIALVDRKPIDHGGSQLVPTLSLEGFGGIGVSGEVAGKPAAGAVLTLGVDFFSTLNLRIPSGRPLRDGDGEAVLPAVRGGNRWAAAAHVDLEGTTAEERARAGARWLDDARMEHASIAAFAALALDLLAAGAAPELVERAHRAALDEARHARVCFGFASAYLERTVEPGPLATDDAARTSASLERLALGALVDGALGEGGAAAILRARARVAREPAVALALRRIARDEARHAELGWDVLRFCVGEGGPALGRDVERAWTRVLALGDEEGTGEGSSLARHGLLSRSSEQRTFARARRAVTRRLRLLLTAAQAERV